MNEAIKLAKIQERERLISTLVGVVTNPLVLGVAGIYLSDRLQGDYVDTPVQMPGYMQINRQWVRDAGKLNKGGALAMQIGIAGYLASYALAQFQQSASLLPFNPVTKLLPGV